MINNKNENKYIEIKKSRERKNRIQTEGEFELALKKFFEEKKLEHSKAGAKLNLGDGLILFANKNGKMYFQLIFSNQGKGSSKQIGQYPNINFYEAREKADDLRRKIIKEKENKSNQQFYQKIKNSKKLQNSLCFKGMDDAKLFADKLLKTISFAPNLSSKNAHLYQACIAIYLNLLFPDMGNILFKLKKSEIMHYNDSPNLPINFGIPRNSFISQEFNRLIEVLDSISIEWDPNSPTINVPVSIEISDMLFPDFYKKNEKEISQILTHEMIDVWPNYRIDVKKFKFFFEHYATLNGGFSSELIKKLCEQEPRPFNPNDPSWKNYRFQICALRCWWCEQFIQQK